MMQKENRIMKKTSPFKKALVTLLLHMWLIGMVIIVLVPLLWMVNIALTDTQTLENVPFIPNPAKWSLANYKDLFTYKSSTDQFFSDYFKSFFTTLSIASVNTVLVVIISSLVGYSFSRYKFKGKKKVLLGMLTLQMFPSFMGMLAIFMLFRQFGLLNNPVALALVYTTGAIPFNTFIVRGFMSNIPKSLDEAASIDGASNIKIMMKIIFPLSVPIMGFIAVTSFMAPWLDYILPSIVMPQNETVAVWLFRFMNPVGGQYNPVKFMSGALFLVIPIMSVQIYMQKYLIYGLTSGAEKG